jgi:hypothetical protein
MARPIHFPEADFIFTPPSGYETEIASLPAKRRDDGIIVCCWQPSPEEIAEIVRTGRIWLAVWCGLRPPPVQVDGFKDAVLPGS